MPKEYANSMQMKKGAQGKNLETPLFTRGPTWNRTRHPLIMSQML